MRVYVLPIAALTACASPATVERTPSTVLAGLVPGETKSCVALSPSQSLTILDNGVVGYRSGRTTWVNRLPAQCARMQPLTTLVVEASGNQVCRGDRVRVIDHPLTVPGPQCILGDFVAYSRP